LNVTIDTAVVVKVSITINQTVLYLI